jgi:hypothetical protein
MKRPSGDDIIRFARDNRIILALLAAAVIIYVFSFQAECETPDGIEYMRAGKELTTGNYPYNMLFRPPLLPVLFEMLTTTGLSILSVRFIVPLFFTLLAVAATYLLAKDISGKRAGEISAALLLCFSEFWGWSARFLTDIPMVSLTAFSLLFLIRWNSTGNRKNLAWAVVAMAAAVFTKPTALLLPAAVFLLFLTPAKKMLKGGRPLLCTLMATFAVSAAISLLWYGGGDSIRPFGEIVYGKYIDVLYPARLVLFPLLVFLPLGILPLWNSKGAEMKRLLLLYSLAFCWLIFFFWVIRLRYFSPLYPIMMLCITEGFFWAKSKKSPVRKFIVPVFIVLAAASFVNATYIIGLNSGALWGAETLSSYTRTLEGQIASDYLPDYLNLTAPAITNSGVLKNLFYGSSPSADGLKASGAKYIMLSVYGEFARAPSAETYHPTFLGVEVPFVSRPYTNERVPPSYTFRSDLYAQIESDASFTKIKEISSPSGQKLFLVYEFTG